MPRRTVFLSLLLLAGCAGEEPAFSPRGEDIAGVVEMTNTFAFAPDLLTVPAGTTVEWRNSSLVAHRVIADPAKVNDPGDVALPEGAAPFDSGEIGRGQIWRHTFTVPGTYRYVRPTYDWLGMTGTIEVTAPLGDAPLVPAAKPPTS